ncbi:MAG TPA: glucose-6-phosphate dehydrogenase [Dissulfurispiraceae bacterium]|nr:glucose-6-phosphate dehydrogenase [Dissulfurispiraceae bacterium]
MTDKAHEIVDSRYLQSCDMPQEKARIGPFTFVIFGGTGDLSRKKLIPTLFSLFQGRELPEQFSILGFGRTEMTDGEFRALISEAVAGDAGAPFQGPQWDEFGSRLYYESGHVGEDETMKRLSSRIGQLQHMTGKERNIIYYLAVPPDAMPAIINRLKDFKLCEGTRIIVEKPFGSSRSTARRLNGVLRSAFAEEQIYRIDHYLGKETVQNIMFLRFVNPIFERLWSERNIDNVQITVAEDIGIGMRGEFYERNGIVRDIIQNHVLQLIGMVAMEPPIGFQADYIRDEKIKVVRSIRHMEGDYIDRFMVRGQYGSGKISDTTVEGYRNEPRVSPSSMTPTFFAGKFHVDNLRWATVPFYVRAGKRLKRRITEICLQFKQLPLRLFGRICDTAEPNALILTIQPEERISVRFSVKYPFSENQLYPVNMDFCYGGAFPQHHYDAYERLLIDCMKGDLTLFVREDMVDAMWEVADPIIARWEASPPVDFPNYEAGSWGPAASDRLIQEDGHKWLTG